MARDGVPMTPDTIMLWMSATKPITVVALAQVWERGKIALDDPVAKYIPAFGAKGKDVITIRHVLTHTGGFRAAVGPWTADPWDSIIAQICDAEIEPGWIIGQTSGYHIAPAWYLLAEIVRRVSADGRPYSKYVREEILEPLGMRDTWIGMPAARWREYGDRIAPMHFGSTVKPPGLYPYAPWSNSAEAVAIERPGGNGRGPIHDLGRFYEAMLAGGEGVVTPQTIEAIARAIRSDSSTRLSATASIAASASCSTPSNTASSPHGTARDAREGRGATPAICARSVSSIRRIDWCSLPSSTA